MKTLYWTVLPALILAAPASATPKKGEDQAAAAAMPASIETETPKACKKKKGKGLGGVLRAARSSGLTSIIAGRAGTGGALVNSATNTAIDVAEAAGRMAPPEEKPKC